MKKRLLSTILLFITMIPSVLAANDSIFKLVFGTTDENLIMLRVAYAMLLFVFVYRGARETVFREAAGGGGHGGGTASTKNLSIFFSLAFVFLAEHFTPDHVLANFGWILMFLAPLIIFYQIFRAILGRREAAAAEGGETHAGEGNPFNWPAAILSLIATIVLFFFVGGNNNFSASIGKMPFLGPALDELFSDVGYYLFYGTDNIVLIIIFAL